MGGVHKASICNTKAIHHIPRGLYVAARGLNAEGASTPFELSQQANLPARESIARRWIISKRTDPIMSGDLDNVLSHVIMNVHVNNCYGSKGGW